MSLSTKIRTKRGCSIKHYLLCFNSRIVKTEQVAFYGAGVHTSLVFVFWGTVTFYSVLVILTYDTILYHTTQY